MFVLVCHRPQVQAESGCNTLPWLYSVLLASTSSIMLLGKLGCQDNVGGIVYLDIHIHLGFVYHWGLQEEPCSFVQLVMQWNKCIKKGTR